MSEFISKHKNKAMTGGALGLNAAAIIFLYTHFVPRTEYEKLEQRYEKTQQEVVMLRTSVAVLNAIEGKQWE